MNNTTHKLIIIGAGPAGLTAAIYAARANLQPLIIEGPNPGGQLMGTSIIENWPGTSEIMGPQLMLSMREHAKKFGTEFISESVTSVDFSQRPFKIVTDRKKELFSHAIIIATGATPRRLGVPGEDTYWGKGITTCAVCDGAFYKDRTVVVVGGGDTSMEEASFLRKFTDKITIIQNLETLSASHAMQQRVINDPAIKIVYNSTVSKFDGDGSKLTSLTITDLKTKETRVMPTDGAFIAIGINPNSTLFKGQLDLDQRGYVKVTNLTQTSVKGVFAAGDVHDFRYRQAITSAGAGCMASLDAEHYLKEIGK